MNSSNPRPPLVILTIGLYWCLALATAAYFIFALFVRGKILEMANDFGFDAKAPAGEDALMDMIRQTVSLSTFITFSATTVVMAGLMGAFGATLLFLRQKSGLHILRGITWLVALPVCALCLWCLMTQGKDGLGSLVRCIPFALLLGLLYCGPVQKHCAAPELA